MIGQVITVRRPSRLYPTPLIRGFSFSWVVSNHRPNDITRKPHGDTFLPDACCCVTEYYMSDRSAVRFSPWETEIEVENGTSVLDAADQADIQIESLCGGKGLCGTCKVVVDDGEECLSEVTDADELLLSNDQLDAGYRLSCRAAVDCGPVDVTVPNVSQNTGGIVLTEGQEIEVELDPPVTNYHVGLEPPSLSDNTADLERVNEAIEENYDVHIEEIDPVVHRELPGTIREVESNDELHVTVTVYDDREIIDVTPGWDETMYGLAIDIGTTTVAVYLVDLQTGDQVAVSSMMNPQGKHGGDIMSRMRHTRQNENGREELQTAIIDGINQLIAEVIDAGDIDGDDVYEAVFVGNTAMHHLFLGIDPHYVAGSPYVAANHAPVQVKARELDVDINGSGYLYWLPISGGWVGPDKVSVLLVSGHHKRDEMTVCVDIGTNGEISVGNAERMWATSAPAGPALEGAEITHGVRAQDGAIEFVTLDVKTLEPDFDVIGDEEPIGICGSGIIDVLAEFFETGTIDQRGQFQDAVRDHDRIRTNEDGVVEFVLVRDEESGIDGDIVVTQNDLREVQQAKSAIQAGTRVLMDELEVEQVDRVVLAGAFGNYIDPESAMTVGLYPDVAFDKVDSLGNAAGIGAQLALLNTDKREEATEIVDHVEYFEIAGTEVFRNNFMDCMYVPHKRMDLYPSVRDRIGEFDDDRGAVVRDD